MANIKDLKKRIRSTKQTLKITLAMKLVAASKLAKAQMAIINSRPYSRQLEDTIKTVASLVENYSHPFLKENNNEKAILLVITSDKGLCGGYNSQMIRMVDEFVHNFGQDKLKIHYIGKKAYEVLSKKYNSGKLFAFEKSDPTFKELNEIANELSANFISGEIGTVYVAYNLFNSALSYVPSVKKILPITLPVEEKEKIHKNYPFDFKYEPSAEKLLDSIIPEAYISSFYTSFLDAQASEHGARMTAMDSATNNCKDMIKKVTLKMNKLRQAAITTELIEVISGAEALNG